MSPRLGRPVRERDERLAVGDALELDDAIAAIEQVRDAWFVRRFELVGQHEVELKPFRVAVMFVGRGHFDLLEESEG